MAVPRLVAPSHVAMRIYPKALSRNSIPTNASIKRIPTTASTNTMPKAIMRSLAASLLMSQGMLCNVTEPETLGYEIAGGGVWFCSLAG